MALHGKSSIQAMEQSQVGAGHLDHRTRQADFSRDTRLTYGSGADITFCRRLSPEIPKRTKPGPLSLPCRVDKSTDPLISCVNRTEALQLPDRRWSCRFWSLRPRPQASFILGWQNAYIV